MARRSGHIQALEVAQQERLALACRQFGQRGLERLHGLVGLRQAGGAGRRIAHLLERISFALARIVTERPLVPAQYASAHVRRRCMSRTQFSRIR